MPTPIARRANTVRVPSDTVITARSLAGIARRFTATALAELVELMIDELDARVADPDMEPDEDGEE